MSISAIVLSFSGVGFGRHVDHGEFQAVAQTGGAGPSPARHQPLIPGRSCQPELICDLLDVNAIKTIIVARHCSLVYSSVGAPPLAAVPGMRNELGLASLGESKCGFCFLKFREPTALPRMGAKLAASWSPALLPIVPLSPQCPPSGMIRDACWPDLLITVPTHP